jgi:hypothetical protein
LRHKNLKTVFFWGESLCLLSQIPFWATNVIFRSHVKGFGQKQLFIENFDKNVQKYSNLVKIFHGKLMIIPFQKLMKKKNNSPKKNQKNKCFFFEVGSPS